LVEHGIANIFDVEGDAEDERGRKDQRPEQRKGDPDRITHELYGLAPCDRPDAARIEPEIAPVRTGARSDRRRGRCLPI
jgi:hypothetical protein